MKKLSLFFLLVPGLLAAQQQETLNLSGQTVVLELPAQAPSAAVFDNNELVNGRYYRLVRFAALPSREQKKALEAAGFRVLNYIDNNTYTVSVSSTADFSKTTDFGIQAVFVIADMYKMHQELLTAISKKEFPDFALDGKNHAGITFTYYSDIAHEKVMQELRAKNFTVTYDNKNSHRITAWVPRDDIFAFAALPYVCAAELKDAPPQQDNNVGRTNHRDNWLAADHPGGRNYNGSGVNVMLQDDGVIGPHIDYTGRLIQQYITFNSGNHGDHCAGIIMGGGNKDPLTRGMGWGANLYVYEASPYQGFDSIYSHYAANNIVITSTSYSDGCNAGYTTLAQTLDQQIYDMPNLIHVFSAGNTGTSDCGYGAGAGWGNVTGGHKHSKNSIAVGNLTYMDAIAASSSRGPVHDGRMKPEVCAVGTNVYSTVDPNDYEYKTGTSMSCPAVSGTFSELYQAYRALNGNATPKSGLMKAILMNTADDLGNAGPDFIYGYGRINGRRAILPIEQNYYLTDSVANSASHSYSITVPANTGRLRVLVYWHDYPAAVNASVALVNNLNMTVTDPGNNMFNPWVLDYTANATNLNTTAVRGIDIRNNHEQVTIDNPTAGSYTITVNGANVPQGPQTYFVTWYFEPANEIVMTYPNGSEGFVPGETETIRWDAFGNSSSFTLDYSTDNGNSWTNAANSIPASQRYFNWTVPSALSGNCKMRITRSSVSDESDAVYSIIPVPGNLAVAWACPDSLLLTWDAVAGATGYDVFMLGSMYMDSIGTTAADSFVVHNLNNLTNTYWFSVRARGPQQAVGRRAIAIEKLPGTFCPAPYDASVTSVSSPSGTFNSCMNTSGLSVSMQLENPGQNTISNVPVFYQLNNGTPVNETYPGTLASAGTATYTFTTLLNVSAPGVNTIKVWAQYPSDNNDWNDTATATVTISTAGTVTPPWSEDFEGFTLCGTGSDCGATSCGMINGFINLANGSQDAIDWRTNEGNTPSTQTGPADDFIPGTATGNYLYLEASGSCDQQTAELYTPCIDLSNMTGSVLNFGYHMDGANMGSLHVDAYSGGSWTNDIFVMNGAQGTQWNTAIVSLNAFAGQVITLRFRGITGNGYASDMAIDGISISDPSSVREIGSSAIHVYPNPASGIFNLSAAGLNNENVVANVYDVTGRLIFSQSYGTVTASLQTAIDLTAFENGLYYLEIRTGEKKTTLKLEKVN